VAEGATELNSQITVLDFWRLGDGWAAFLFVLQSSSKIGHHCHRLADVAGGVLLKASAIAPADIATRTQGERERCAIASARLKQASANAQSKFCFFLDGLAIASPILPASSPTGLPMRNASVTLV
jgi:hypothetical protein